jgi:hypothetical protein
VEHPRQPLSAVLCLDRAGAIEEIGPGRRAFESGEEVYSMIEGGGGLLSLCEAAALHLSAISAWESGQPHTENTQEKMMTWRPHNGIITITSHHSVDQTVQ